MGEFADKTILVTGASSGIGRAAAMKLGQMGARVIVAARREKQARETVAAITERGGRARWIPVDIADGASVGRLFDTVESELGRLDGAFNNAGIEADHHLVPDTPEALFDRVMNTNVRGTWLCMRREMRIMRAQGFGSIVNTSSLAGIMAFPMSSVYTASKHAIVGMTKSAALDFPEKGIRVNCLCPGGTRTPMAERWAADLPGGMAAMETTIPMKRCGEPEELAEAAIWLLSNGASYVTGAVLVADGGFSLS